MTLDEVIENLSVKQSLKDLGHRPDPDEIADALYYLREYREKKHEISDISADYIAMKNYWAEQQVNSPLTWDELKQMIGKPVWIEWDDSEEAMRTKEFVFSRQWEIISEVYEENIVCIYSDRRAENHFAYSKDNLGKTWQAFRKERK